MFQYKSLRSLWKRYLGPHSAGVVMLGLLLCLTTALQLIQPMVVRHFIDSAFSGKSTHILMMAAFLYVGCAFLSQVFQIADDYLAQYLGWVTTNAMRLDLTRHCLKLDTAFYNSHSPGEMLERIDGDVGQLSEFFSRFVIDVFGNLILLVGIMAIVYSIDWRMGISWTIFIVAALAIVRPIQRLSTPLSVKYSQARADWAGYLEERLAGTEDVRSCGASAYVLQRFYPLMRNLLVTIRKANIVIQVGGSTFTLLSNVMLLVAGASGAYLFYRHRISLGTVYLLFNYSGQLLERASGLADQFQGLQTVLASMQRVQQLFETQSTIVDGAGVQFPSGALSIKFDGVSFGYDPGQRVLDNLSFHLAPGKTLGLLGRTGGGKTTLTRLLFRLYDPTQGAVQVGGVNLRDMRVADVRRRVGMATQDVKLFHATLRDNLTLFDRAVSDDRILMVIDDLGLRSWYDGLPNGLDEVLESGGLGLSAGESQLLALTRVFLKQPDLVILDEPTSRLDPATERLVQRAIEKLLNGRTGIIIAHRLSTVQRVDDILILDNGRVCEYGRRRELATDRNSRFYSLLQMGIDEVLA